MPRACCIHLADTELIGQIRRLGAMFYDRAL